ncbi:flagellar motor stator protein MotA [Alkalihalobacterium bogoriense]|uniref:flagellar motor stator protein MotA n=1 Tax=Alkalihalobacterium bogoriense TaxID=246272 RepID=UPI00047EA864|nr:flagellar motor stator protein MotA [Alkalihalobacterium bogoriense]
MDKSSIIGIILGVLAIVLGMVFKGTSLMVLVNPAAIMIIGVGTVASLLIAFPMSEIKKVPKLFKILFTEKKQATPQDLIQQLVELGTVSRQEGMLALESKVKEIENSFMKQAIRMISDGMDPDFIRNALSEKIESMRQRHSSGAQIFTQAGTYAPTLGVLGAVLGLIAALGNMDDTEALGHAIAAAFVATLFGIFCGYVLWHPFANKLKQKSKREAFEKYLIIEGAILIIDGVSPRQIEETLSMYLEEGAQEKLLQGSEA